ncbi:MAG: hypothetical protein RIC19_09415 [Phaeodactylibacter sp.]|uniref:hypothetical protein n=1 Tax=Phaeodactylibacter sp. TaxID=1940289 RepID=UPI0032EEE756
MSIKTDNRGIALQALEAFQAFEKKYMDQGQTDAEKVKHLLNAVQQVSLKLGAQGLRRCMLYMSGQMSKGKEENGFDLAKAYSWLYGQMAYYDDKEKKSYQYHILCIAKESNLAKSEARLGFFLLCLKRLAAAYHDEKLETGTD